MYSINWTGIVLCILFFIINAKEQELPNCFDEGECINTLFVDYRYGVKDAQACLDRCQRNHNCEYFTFYGDNDDLCMELASCEEFSAYTCVNCFSGSRTCEDLQCLMEGRCNGKLLAQSYVYDNNACLEDCNNNDNCSWVTYDTAESSCFLFEDCQSTSLECSSCVTSQTECPKKEYTKLVVVGGYNEDLGGDLSRVEVVDLKGQSSTCEIINDYPINASGMTVGVVNGIIKSCGSSTDISSCFDYNPTTKLWTNSSDMIHDRYYPRSSFIDGVWLVTGDDDFDFYEYNYIGEVWTGTEFEEGPLLPDYMYRHCQLTVNNTHVFLADTYFHPFGPNYLLDWNSKTWTTVPGGNSTNFYSICGLVNNPENGPEIVMVDDDTTEIFNLETLTWRAGPPSPGFYRSSSFAQITDTFVIVGGRSPDVALDTIFQFDLLNYRWILNEQTLKVPSYDSGAIAVPDDFISCS